jgi:hypothetical protein
LHVPPSPQCVPAAKKSTPHWPLVHTGVVHCGFSDVVQTCPHVPQSSTLFCVLVHVVAEPAPFEPQQTSDDGQERFGLFIPGGTGEQVPGELGSLHASHVPRHAVEQHTPSAQKPLVHWTARMHVWPAPRVGLQTPLSRSQNWWSAHSESPVQGAHVPALQ